MSFILDALKKSESERQRQSGPALLEMRIVRPARALPAWALVVGALLILSVVVLAWMALRPVALRTPSAAQLATATARSGADGIHALAPSAGAEAGTTATPIAPSAASAPAPSPSPSAANGAAAANAADAANTAEAADAVEAPVNPADSAPAVATNPDSSPAAEAHGNLQNYAAVSGTVPELRLDLHVYAPNPADRYAFINMHKVREGDVTPEGVQVRQITREGVVLEYQGAEFLLGR